MSKFVTLKFAICFWTLSQIAYGQNNTPKTWYTYWQNAKRKLPKIVIPDLTFDVPQNIEQFNYALKTQEGQRITVYGANRFTRLTPIGTASGGGTVTLTRFRVFNYRNYFEIERPESFESFNTKGQTTVKGKSKVWVKGSDISASLKN